MTVLYIVLALLGIWWGVTGWFFALAKAAELKDAGAEFGWFIKGGIYPYLALGVIIDFLFNVIYGTIIFREWPRELLFTSRVKRHVRMGSKKGFEWRDTLNKIMPGHV